MFFLSYTDPAQRMLAFSVVDVQAGAAWSPAARAFVATATAPADALVPLTRMQGPNWSTVLLGFLPDLPDPPAPGRYLVYIHPAAGGPPVDAPLEVGCPLSRRLNIAVQVSPP